MTIKSRLQITSLLFVAVALGVGLILLMGLRSLYTEFEKSRLNYAVVSGLVDLTTLADDYVMHTEKRSLRQWQAKYGDVGMFLRKRAESEIIESGKTDRLIKEYEEINSIFSQLVSAQDRIRSGDAQSKTLAELRDRLMGMLVLRLQSIVADARSLYGTSQARIDARLATLLWVLALFVVLTASIILGNHVLTRNTVVRPLRRLIQDTEILAGGNLNHVVDIRTRDEMGHLAQAFNRMTEELSTSYKTLEAEICERKLAQEGLTKHRDHLEELVEERSHELRRTNEELQREIEERKRAELSLQNEKYLSDMAIECLPGVFYLFDDRGKFLRWNKNFQRVSGYTAEEITEMHPLDLFVDDDRRTVEDAIQLVFVHGETEVEADLISRTGIKTPYSFTGVRIALDDNLYLIGTGIDVTERKRAESAIARYVKELERTNTELEQFAFVSSHHLQEPLRKIINYAQLLERRYKQQLDERADRYLDYVVDGALRMRALIEDLQTFTGLDKAEPLRERVNVNEVVRKILSGLDDTVRATGGVVTSNELPFIMADAREMTQLFQNLITNSLKFHGSEAPLIHISAEERNAEWTFSVRDNGMGIDPQYQEQIFGIFQRLHKAGEYPGTGIGAALCKKIVERHGGRIWVESKPGSGSIFSFTIPAL